MKRIMWPPPPTRRKATIKINNVSLFLKLIIFIIHHHLSHIKFTSKEVSYKYIVLHFLLHYFMTAQQLPWLSKNAKKNAPKFYPSFISGALRDLFSRRLGRYCDMKRLKLFWICFGGAYGFNSEKIRLQKTL